VPVVGPPAPLPRLSDPRPGAPTTAASSGPLEAE
jgi:hypothetical protein